MSETGREPLAVPRRRPLLSERRALEWIRRHEASVAAAASVVVVTALTYPRFNGVGPGLDMSWHTGLFLGVHRGLDFGSDIVFTYGPLGFLKFPALYYVWPSLAAWVYVTLFRIAATALLYVAARRILRSRAAAFVAALVAALAVEQPRIWELGYAAPVTVLVVVWCGLALQEGPDRLSYRLVPVVGGAVAAIEFLAKLTIGVLVPTCLLYVVLVVGHRRLRDVAVLAVSFAVTVVLALLAVGQPLSGLGAYARSSWEIASGFSVAMGGPIGLRSWVLAAVSLALLLAGAAAAARGDRRLQLALLGLLVLYGFQVYKASFVAGGGHLGIFFTSMVGAWFAVPWQRLGRPVLAAPAAAGALVALVLLLAAGTGVSVRDAVAYGAPLSERFDDLRQDARLVLEPSGRREAIADDRASLRDAYRISPRLLAAVGSAPVHVDPWETSVVWAYGLDWRPEPVFQAYQAYTRHLDEMNADTLRRASGPRMILREIGWVPLDRNPSFESPAAVVAMLCHFVHVAAAGDWEVLRRTADRCGPARPIGRTELRYGGTPVRVPQRPGSLVVARLDGVGDGLLGRVRAFAYRSPVRTITVNGHAARLVPGTAADGLLMHVPGADDYPGAFRLSPDARTLTVDDEGHSGRTIRVTFYAMPIRP